VESALDVPVELILVISHGERHLFAGRDVDIDERSGDVGVTETAPEVAVAEELPAVTLDAIARQPKSLRGEIRRLELFDQPRTLGPLDAAVEASGENGSPIFDGDPRLEMDLASVGGVSVAPPCEHAGVDLASDAETPPSIAAIESHPTESLVFGELSDVDLERLRDLVEFHGDRRNAR
jgi:hypothetical protein